MAKRSNKSPGSYKMRLRGGKTVTVKLPSPAEVAKRRKLDKTPPKGVK
jgi:hypothetical protein